MTGAEILLDRFDALIDTPEAVERLRRFALRLCVTGRLTRSVPGLWPEVTLGDVVGVTGGGTPSKRNAEFWEDGTIPWVSPKDMKVWEIEDSQDHVTEAAVEGSAAKWIEPGDVLIVVRGMILAHTAPAALLRVPATINQDMKALRPADGVESEFLLRLLWGLNADILDRVETSSHGTKRLPTDALLDLPFRLPPVEEQRRIVARVDELMALCDRLADGLARRDALRQRWAASTVRHVTEDAPIAGAPAWSFAEAHLDTLLADPEAVPLVRRMVLDLAVRGRLTEQDPADEPAEVLLQRIAEEKRRRYEAGEIRKPVKTKAISNEEKPYALPTTWRWSRLNAVADLEMGQSPPGSSYNTDGEGTVLVNGPAELRKGDPFADSLEVKYTTDPGKTCRRGDLLLAVRATVGETNVASRDLCIGRGVAALSPLIDFRYFGWHVQAARERLVELGSGSTFIQVSKKDIAGLLVAVPPVEEQRQIVARVDELMALCDRLADGLRQSQAAAERLLASVLVSV